MMFKTCFSILLLATGLCQILAEDDDCGADVDLILNHSTFTITNENVTLEWELRNKTQCAVEYHLVVNDEERGVIKDVILEENFAVLDSLSPCIQYEMGITAINKALPTIKGPKMTLSILFSAKAQGYPRLKSLDVQTTSINLMIALEGDKNRCPLDVLYVDGGVFFNQTVPLQNLVDTSEAPVEIKSLLPNRLYQFQLYVVNSGGVSPPYNLGVQTLPV